MIDQNKLNNKVDLDKINSNQPLNIEKKKEKRFSFSFLYNIFNKSFKFNFKWRI